MDFTGRTITWAALRVARAPLLLVLLSLTAACTTNGSGPVATTSSFGPTVAFESVDGPPPQVFDRLVRALETESTARSFTIVSREAQASYRVRSYLSAQVRRGKTTIAWVWDVYDRDQERAVRLSGEEPAGTGGRDAWAMADDQLMRRIALAGLNGLNGLISGTAPAQEPAPAAPRTSGPAIAQTDENRPESGPGRMQTLAFSAH
ncbi:MAG: hypothetical protein EKK35_06045 [Bradyrhizobiaceae bacterium]|nr:MAG: hypothetical protein EKK35_06045 [Bradyrhizobiaceae bacterium]